MNNVHSHLTVPWTASDHFRSLDTHDHSHSPLHLRSQWGIELKLPAEKSAVRIDDHTTVLPLTNMGSGSGKKNNGAWTYVFSYIRFVQAD